MLLPSSTAATADEVQFARIKFVVLVTLCCQNAGHALITRYSQGVLKESYSSTEVVLVAEVIKLFVSAYLALSDRSETDAVGAGFYKLLWLIMHAKKIILLVILYSICNLLSYYALARVEAAVYTVLLQLKIFTTAAFAVLLLGRNISSAKWRSLFLLVLGCILVASPTFNRCICDFMEKDSASSEEKVPWYESTLGILGVITMVTISGYSSIYFESMLKRVGEKITIWERNFQLAFYSALLLIVIVVWEMKIGHMADIRFFQGWTINTVIVALVQAGGGLLVAATLKYADSILKTLATSGAIVISAVLGNLLLGGVLDIFVSIGCLATILAIFNYTFDS